MLFIPAVLFLATWCHMWVPPASAAASPSAPDTFANGSPYQNGEAGGPFSAPTGARRAYSDPPFKPVYCKTDTLCVDIDKNGHCNTDIGQCQCNNGWYWKEDHCARQTFAICDKICKDIDSHGHCTNPKLGECQCNTGWNWSDAKKHCIVVGSTTDTDTGAEEEVADNADDINTGDSGTTITGGGSSGGGSDSGDDSGGAGRR